MLSVMKPVPAPEGVRLNIRLDAELHRALRLLAVESGVPLTVLVPRLLRAALAAAKTD